MSIYQEAEKLRKEIEEDQEQKLKIALFGQPGAGKSSLINLIVGQSVAKTGVSTDVTVDAQIIEHEDMLSNNCFLLFSTIFFAIFPAGNVIASHHIFSSP